jgi:hypothetical protein
MGAFIRPREAELLRSGRFFPRFIDEPDEAIPPFSLVSGIVREVDAWEGSERLFKGIAVEVANGDGMSWSAQAVSDALASRFPRLRLAALPDFPDAEGLPAVSALLDRTRFLKLAATRKLCQRHIAVGMWFSISICLGVLVALSEVAKVLFKDAMQGPAMQVATFLTLSSLLGITGVLVPLLNGVLAKRSLRDVQKELKGAIAEQERSPSIEYWNWIADLANELAAFDRSRAVIVDDFQGQDATTRNVLNEYFRSAWKQTRSAAFWLIFEQPAGERIRTRKKLEGVETAFRRFECYRQRYLSDDDRRRLADAVGHPERAGLSTVLGICGPDMTRLQWIGELFRRFEDPSEDRRPLALLYLRALESPNLSGQGSRVPPYRQLEMSWKTFARWAPDGMLISRAQAGQHSPRGTLFSAALGVRFTKEEFDRASHSVNEEFGSCLEGGSGQFVVTNDVAQWFWSSWRKLSLPPPGLGKVYWVLTLAERLNREEPACARRIAGHLIDIDLDALPGEMMAEAAGELRKTALKVFDTCVLACIVDEILPLARRLVTLARSVEADDAWRDELVTSLVRAYSLLADDKLLEAIGDLVPEGSPAPSSEYDRLLNLYMNVLGPGAQPLYRAVQNLRETDLGRRVAEYLDARAFWLVSVFGRLAESFSHEPKGLGLWNWKGLPEHFAAVARRISERLAAGRSITDLELATITMSVWASARAIVAGLGAPGAVFDLFAAASNALGATRPEFRGRARHYDFLAEALSIELRAIARAAVHVLEEAGAPIPPDLLLLCGDCDREAPRAESAETPSGPVIGWLALNSLVWNHLGFLSLTAIADLRRLELEDNALGLDEERRSVRDEVMNTIARMEERGSYHAVLGNLLVAHASRGASEVAAVFLERALGTLSEIGARDAVVNPLALIAVLRRSGSREAVERILRSNGGPSTIRRYLAHVTDDELPFIILELSNGGARVGAWAEVMQEVKSSVRERGGAVPAAAGEVIEALELLVNLKKSRISHQAALDWLNAHPRPLFSWERPMLLSALVASGWWSDAFDDEMLALLSIDPASDDVTGTYHLSVGIMLRTIKREPLDPRLPAAAVAYARGAAWKFANIEPVLANIRVFRMLFQLDEPYRDRYRDAIDYWTQVRIDRDHVERLFALKRDGRFIVFETYVRYGLEWGLPILAADPQPDLDPSAFVDRWKQGGAEVPSPIVERNGVAFVNGEFLLIGSAIFRADVQSHRSDRMRISDAADREFRRLVTSIVSLPAIPPPVAQLIRRRSEELQRGSEPVD